ncbi:MAG TPA: hypothetical protein VIH40_07860 [Xanthobacteraceae bacterium]
MATASKAVSFVARIWLESGPNGDACWRGYVKHVQSGRGSFFDDLRALRTFVEGTSGIAGAALQLRPRRAGHAVAAGARKRAPARPKKQRNV